MRKKRLIAPDSMPLITVPAAPRTVSCPKPTISGFSGEGCPCPSTALYPNFAWPSGNPSIFCALSTTFFQLMFCASAPRCVMPGQPTAPKVYTFDAYAFCGSVRQFEVMTIGPGKCLNSIACLFHAPPKCPARFLKALSFGYPCPGSISPCVYTLMPRGSQALRRPSMTWRSCPETSTHLPGNGVTATSVGSGLPRVALAS
mmetsp:Transcript_20648/g.47827  ORF Transcript_20648/g.47827 Transcript_20648/m.47827 type:complete len:201 (+) Transcript_20648:570-1172(+)